MTKPSLIQGVAVELRQVLPAAWVLSSEGNSFVVRGPLSAEVVDGVWRIVRFVAYAEFHALRRTVQTDDELRFELLSHSSAGLAFRVEFIFTQQKEA